MYGRLGVIPATDMLFPIGIPAGEGHVVDREQFVERLAVRGLRVYGLPARLFARHAFFPVTRRE